MLRLTVQGVNGNKMEKACDLVHITLNKNAVVGDVSALAPGGVRIGAPAMTSRGLRETDFETIATLLDEVRSNPVISKLNQGGPGPMSLFFCACSLHHVCAASKTMMVGWFFFAGAGSCQGCAELNWQAVQGLAQVHSCTSYFVLALLWCVNADFKSVLGGCAFSHFWTGIDRGFYHVAGELRRTLACQR